MKTPPSPLPHLEPDAASFAFPPGDIAKEGPPAQWQTNAVGVWPDKGIVGTQLGPNENGRQW